MTDARRRFEECAFFVLGLKTDASRAEIERTAQRLLSEITIGRAAAKTYATPFGPRERTEDLVRAASAALRDPRTRLAHEAIARAAAPMLEKAPPSFVPWRDVMRRMGFGRGTP